MGGGDCLASDMTSYAEGESSIEETSTLEPKVTEEKKEETSMLESKVTEEKKEEV